MVCFQACHGNGADSTECEADSGGIVGHFDRCEGKLRNRLCLARADFREFLWLSQAFRGNDKASDQFS